MTTRCPSELELEAYELGLSREKLEPHVAGCLRCRGELAEMRRAAEEFRRDVFPRTVDTVVERSGRRSLPRWAVAALPLTAAAAAAVLLVGRPSPDYVGTKGAPRLGLTVFVNDAGGARPVQDGAMVPARAAIRFQVQPARACRLWVLSVDGAGQVSRLFPQTGGAADVDAASTLPGGAVLDGQAGPERIFAVCSPAPLPFADVERRAREVGAGGTPAVRSAARLGGLPRDSTQATLLLEKRP